MDNQPQPPTLPDNNAGAPGPQSPLPPISQPGVVQPAVTPQPFSGQAVPPPSQPVQPAVVGSSKKKRRIIAIICLLVVAILIAVVTVLAANRSSNSQKGTPATPAQSGSPDSGSRDSTGTLEQKSHDAKRQTDIQALQTQLEAYFSQNGYYPSLTDINTASWRAANMKTLDPTILVDPLSTCDPAATACLVTAPVAKAYSYAVTDGQGKSCESDDTQCAKYSLTATYEGMVNGASTFVKENLD